MAFNQEQESYLALLKENGFKFAPEDVKAVDIKIPSLAGEGTASTALTVDISFNPGNPNKDVNLFVKKITENPGFADFVRELDLFAKEAAFFNMFVKDGQKLCEDVTGSPSILEIFPKCYKATEEVIIMDNLMAQECVLLKKEDRQGLVQAKLLMNRLARLHGVGYAMMRKQGVAEFRKKYATVVKEAFDTPSFEGMMSPMYDNSLRTAIKILKENPVAGSDTLIPALEAYVGSAFKKVMSTLKYSDTDKVLTLTHGDAWNNNMMFHKTKDGEFDSVVLIDFQVARIASPNIDISYYLWTSVDGNVRRNNFNSLMKLYFDEFSRVVTTLNEEVEFHFEDLLADFAQKVHYGYFMGMTSNCAPGAMAELNFVELDSDVGKLMQQVDQIIGAWVQRNPEEAKKIAVDTVADLKEYLSSSGK